MKRVLIALCVAVALAPVSRAGAATPTTTAWAHGRFNVDVPGVVSRSDVVLGRPNTDAKQAMPLGNGTLGVAAWAANGFTAQLNRADTMPDRLSPGQVVIPGLAALTGASDFRGRLDLYDGTFVESGGGLTATAYVRAGSDQLVVDVTGADPAVPQTAFVKLREPRTPTARRKAPPGCWRRPGSTPAVRVRVAKRSARSPRSRPAAGECKRTSSTRARCR